MLTPQWLDELRSRITLSSVIMRTTRLTKAGREWKACCPFHDEKTPSFTVNDEKGFYHCFGCGAHGDAIRWMTDQRGLPFMDAVKELAAEAGIEVPRPDPREAQKAEQRAGLHDVVQAAQDWFVQNLRGADGAVAREYLTGRGFGQETEKEFGFGLAPESRQAMKAGLAQFDDAMLVETGLRIQVEGKESYDRFRGRLMLPIHDMRGRVIAFGGRILAKDTDAPKYLNSPETPLFDKGRTLYNIHRAGPASRKTRRLVVVEGYMDVVALAAAGIADAVAPLGTALTEDQIRLLWRLVDVPVLCFDGDAAGQRAAMRAISRALPMLAPGKSLSFVTLPTGLDPDDLIRQRGRQVMEQMLTEQQSLVDALWQFELAAASLKTPEDKAGLRARLLTHVESIDDRDIASLYRRSLLDRFYTFAFPRREFARGPQGKAQAAPGFMSGQLSDEARGRLAAFISGGARDRLARAVICGLARFPAEIPRHADALARLTPTNLEFAAAIDTLLEAAEMLEAGEETPISAIIDLAAPPDNARFTFLREDTDPQAAREELSEAVALLVERPQLECALAAATERFEQTFDDAAFAEQQMLLKRKLEFEARLGQMATKRAASMAATVTDVPSGPSEQD